MATKNLGRVKGTTFTPSVDADGNLTWSNDGGETNPSSVNIRGKDGSSATIEVNTDTDNEYTLKITDKNGETITPNLKSGGGGAISSDDIATAINNYFTENPVDNSIQYSTMPTASADNVGDIIQYIGATDTNYIKGEFYESILGDDGTTYSWVKINSPLVTNTSDGAMSSVDKIKLDTVEDGAEVNPIMVSEFVADHDYYDKNMISDIAREVHKGKVTQGYRDVHIIPDKYNTGVEPGVSLTVYDANTNVGTVLSGSGNAPKIVRDVDNSKMFMNYYSNTSLADESLVEGYDFSEFIFVTTNTSLYKTPKKIIFRNCKFDSFQHDTGSISNVNIEFEHCKFNGCITGCNMTINSCYLGDSESGDGINPHANVSMKDCFIANLLTKPNTSGGHTDGIQIFGHRNFETKDISLKNVRFAIPNFYFDGTSTSYINGAIMCSLERNNGDNITFEDIIVDMGSRYTPFYSPQPVGYIVTNVLFKNCIVSDNYRNARSLFYQNSYNKLTKVIDTYASSLLYVSSVWKDDSNKTHIICTNSSVISDKDLIVKTNLGDYKFTLNRCPSQTELLEDSTYQSYTYEDMPYDIEFIIEEDINYLICYDGDTQIRFVNFTDEDVYVQTGQGGGNTNIPSSAILYDEQNLTDEQKAQARMNIGAAKDFESSASYQYAFSITPDVIFEIGSMYRCYKISDKMLTKEQILRSSITSDYGAQGSHTRTPVESDILSESSDYLVFQFSSIPRNAFLTAYSSGNVNISISGYNTSINIPETGTYMVVNFDVGIENSLVIDWVYPEINIPNALSNEIDSRIASYIANNNISSGGNSTSTALSYAEMTSKTATINPNTIYNFGTLSASDVLDITFNIPDNASGAEIWHVMFTAGAINQDIRLKTSDGSTLKIHGVTELEVGTTYEISMLKNVVFIG